jgi:malic enzyme
LGFFPDCCIVVLGWRPIQEFAKTDRVLAEFEGLTVAGLFGLFEAMLRNAAENLTSLTKNKQFERPKKRRPFGRRVLPALKFVLVTSAVAIAVMTAASA